MRMAKFFTIQINRFTHVGVTTWKFVFLFHWPALYSFFFKVSFTELLGDARPLAWMVACTLSVLLPDWPGSTLLTKVAVCAGGWGRAVKSRNDKAKNPNLYTFTTFQRYVKNENQWKNSFVKSTEAADLVLVNSIVHTYYIVTPRNPSDWEFQMRLLRVRQNCI